MTLPRLITVVCLFCSLFVVINTATSTEKDSDAQSKTGAAAPVLPPEVSIGAEIDDTRDGIVETTEEPAHVTDGVIPAPTDVTAIIDDNEKTTGVLPAQPFELLGEYIGAGESTRLYWAAGQSFSGGSLDTPVLVARGTRPGPVLCLTAAIHGDELNGVEIIRRVMGDVDTRKLSGVIIGVPIVNLLGFTRSSRYLPDRRDLNRFFPGSTRGSSASRIAHSFFTNIMSHCDYLVDFHTGSFKRTNLPQLRADMNIPVVREFTRYFGGTTVLHTSSGRGTLRNAAINAAIPAVTFELGQPSSLQIRHVEFGVRAMESLLDNLGMVKRLLSWSTAQNVYYSSRWVRADRGGILTTVVKIGGEVSKGDILGLITNPLTNEQTQILSPVKGRVLGMALNQFMLPGFAAFRIGIEGDPDEISKIIADTTTSVTETANESSDSADSGDDGDEGEETAEYSEQTDTQPAEIEDQYH